MLFKYITSIIGLLSVLGGGERDSLTRRGAGRLGEVGVGGEVDKRFGQDPEVGGCAEFSAYAQDSVAAAVALLPAVWSVLCHAPGAGPGRGLLWE